MSVELIAFGHVKWNLSKFLYAKNPLLASKGKEAPSIKHRWRWTVYPCGYRQYLLYISSYFYQVIFGTKFEIFWEPKHRYVSLYILSAINSTEINALWHILYCFASQTFFIAFFSKFLVSGSLYQSFPRRLHRIWPKFAVTFDYLKFLTSKVTASLRPDCVT